MSAISILSLSIVVPVYNNAVTLGELVERIGETCEKCVDGSYEIILIDDGSTDKSWEFITQLSSSKVKGFRLSRNFGQHSALKAGFAHSRGCHVVMLDADLEDSPEIIQQIHTELIDGADICYTNFVEGESAKLRKSSKLFQKFANHKNKKLLGKNIGTMRGFNRKVLSAILRYGERRPVYGPLITSLGFRQAIVDVEVNDIKGKTSSYTFMKRLKLGIDHMVGYTSIVTTFFMIAGFAAFAGSLCYAGLIILQYLFFDVALPPGLSIIIIGMLLLFSVLYFGVGIIGIYMQRLLEENLQRPLYIVSETTAENDGFVEEIGKVQDVRRD